MQSSSTSALATHLTAPSTPFKDPITRIDWNALNNNEFWLPETTLSLYGSSEYNDLAPAQQIKLSHFELLHFIEFGIWLENMFITRLRNSIAVNDDSPGARYSLCIIREEAEHSLMFLEFIKRSGYGRVPINRRSLQLYKLLWSMTAVNSSLFWTFILAGEEIPLRLNKSMLKDRKKINKTVADIVKVHTIEESRHVCHAKAMLTDMLEHTSSLAKQSIQLLLPRLIKQFSTSFYNPRQEIYEMAGLNKNIYWPVIAAKNKTRQAFIKSQMSNILTPLKKYGIY